MLQRTACSSDPHRHIVWFCLWALGHEKISHKCHNSSSSSTTTTTSNAFFFMTGPAINFSKSVLVQHSVKQKTTRKQERDGKGAKTNPCSSLWKKSLFHRVHPKKNPFVTFSCRFLRTRWPAPMKRKTWSGTSCRWAEGCKSLVPCNILPWDGLDTGTGSGGDQIHSKHITTQLWIEYSWIFPIYPNICMVCL